MKKFSGKICAVIFLLITFHSNTAFSAFTDIKSSDRNYDAITFLEQNKIINGYKDGTFKPTNTINRAEFLKIVIEGSKISLNSSTQLPFTDIEQDSWYAPYLEKAYAEKWVVGYNDNTFRPDKTITKAEAVKILGEIQKWDISKKINKNPFDDVKIVDWYAKYIVYAKDHELLEETGKTFVPNTAITRGQISEIIYRTLSTNTDSSPKESEAVNTKESAPQDEPQTQAPATPTNLSFNPVNFKTIPKDFFANIALDDTAPNTFYQNEIYILKGSIVSGNYQNTTILLKPLLQPSNYVTFVKETNNNQFEIPVYFKDTGNYNIGILPGEGGKTKLFTISVLPEIPSPSLETAFDETASSISAGFQNDTTQVSFSSPISTLKRLIFSQNNKKVTYLSRQNVSAIPIDYKDFTNFKEGEISLYIETAKIKDTKSLNIISQFTKSSQINFYGVEHTFDDISKDMIDVSPADALPENSTISFSGTIKTNAELTAYIEKPDGFVDEISLSASSLGTGPLGNDIIKATNPFQFTYPTKSKGRYIVEINDENGKAILNHPVYIGNIIPLIPDYFDMNTRVLFSGNANLSNLRNELLSYINESRKKQGLNELELSDQLNTAAQSHTDDMVNNNYLSHINLQGENQEDRRIKAGVKTPVGENLAQDTSIKFAHMGLMRSAGHRENILDENWTRVGLGITIKNGYLMVAEEFSTTEISDMQIQNLKSDLINKINETRSANGQSSLSYSTLIENISHELNTKFIYDKDILSSAIFPDTLKTYNVTGSSQASGRSSNKLNDLIPAVLTEEKTTILKSIWTKIGIDTQIDSYTGKIYLFFILNSAK